MRERETRRTFVKRSTGLLLGALFGPFAVSAKTERPHAYVERAAFTMGSIVTIKAYGTDRALLLTAIEGAVREMKKVDKLMSVFDAGSELSCVNRRAAEKEVPVSPEIIDVLGMAASYGRLTDGAFDVTIEPLMELYGFRDEKTLHPFPSDRRIASALAAVGMNNVLFDRRCGTVGLAHPETRLDFGGIAVGYAIDRAVDILRSHGVESALVNHSGDMFAIGSPPEEETWRVGIVDPLHDDRVIADVRIRNQALSTSGNYENYVSAGGRTIGHILDPRCGRSASEMLSCTVVAPTAIEADTLSTGIFVLGAERSRHILLGGVERRCMAVVRGREGECVLWL